MRRSALLAIALLSFSAAVACGGDDPGTDSQFVAELCAASRDLQVSFSAAAEEASSQTDASLAAESLVGPLEDFVEAFRDANPPADLEDWHRAASAQLEAAVERFKDEKTLASLEGFGDSPVPDPPADAKARLRAAARDVDDCNGVAFLKPD